MRQDGLRREDWLTQAIIAGFAGTALMAGILAFVYGIIASAGTTSPGASVFQAWAWALTHNVLTQAANSNLIPGAIGFFLIGIVWAVIYAAFFANRLSGSGWRRGMLFALLPWALSLVLFLPAAGGGFLGFALGAGPLPLIGNLFLHLVYGGTLGEVYARQSNDLLVEAGEVNPDYEIRAHKHAEAGSAIGIVGGMAVGAVVGWLGDLALAGGGSALLGAMIGLLLGAAFGALIGSVSGLTPSRS